MLRNIVLGGLLIALVVGAYVGCGPRAQVVGKKVMDQIDSMIGKLDIQQQKVESAYKELQGATEGLREKRINAKVRLESLEAKKAVMLEQKESAMSDLSKLRDMLKEAETAGEIERNGKKVTMEQLKTLAEGTIKKIKLIDTNLSTRNKTLTDAYTKSLEVLTKNEETSKAQLKKLDAQITEIAAKKSALDAMKEASSITGAEESISDKFNELTKDVDDLMVDVDVKIATEIEKVDERAAASDSIDVTLDALLDDKNDVSGTLSDIDALLGGDQ